MSLCELSGGCSWFEFKLWTGVRWVPARLCKRASCAMEAWHNGSEWRGANLRFVWEVS